MARLLFSVSLCLMVVLAHAYCIERHAREAAGIRGDTPAPLSAPAGPSCENESACICKGAVLAVSVQPPSDSGSFEWLLDAVSALVPIGPTGGDAHDALTTVPRTPSPIFDSGTARAWLQSYLL